MHELPMVLDLLELLEKKAKENGIHRITEVDLAVGELSGLVDECVALYFETASERTPAEGAKLKFTHRPAQFRCMKCGRTFPHQSGFTCPYCGGEAVHVRGTGAGFEVTGITGE